MSVLIGIKDLYDLDHTIAAALFEGKEYPWEVLGGIEAFIRALGPTLDPVVFEQRGQDIWIARDATVAPTASLTGPLIVDAGAEIRHCAFIRGSAIVGKGAVVGNSTELKNCVLFDGVQVPHYNYIGDSVLGHKSHFGAGSITSNVKGDKTLVVVRAGDRRYETGRKKVGALAGDFAEIGCNAVLNPGTIIGRGGRVYPLCSVRGFVPAGHLLKSDGTCTPQKVT
ncbi:MAG: UDP-N-acetylglucosamine pyrophosphorylase [Clostridiales bacterium]|nr:UDP-N-acetylglucosamine pyrophosphorylase [Clostridiales bacterium]